MDESFIELTVVTEDKKTKKLEMDKQLFKMKYIESIYPFKGKNERFVVVHTFSDHYYRVVETYAEIKAKIIALREALSVIV